MPQRTVTQPSGMFISFEGIDGAGKSSHIAPLAAAWRAQGRCVTLTREPGGTPLAEKLRAYEDRLASKARLIPTERRIETEMFT